MRVAVIVTARPSWAKLSPVCRALKRRPGVTLQIIACASALLERYGKVVDVIKAEGYEVAAECWSTHEGSNLVTSAKETGALLSELAGLFQRRRPDCVVVCADRHEVLAAAQAAAYLHVPVVHLQGGERSWSIDDRVRDSISHLSDVHCVSTERAKYRVYGLTGEMEHIYHTGCPSIDMARQALLEPPVIIEEVGGVGPPLDLSRPFLTILQHPVTQESQEAGNQLHITLAACGQVPLPQMYFWPGQDAGGEPMAAVVRHYREQHLHHSFHAVRNMGPTRFLRLLSQASVLVGNSSAGIRECSYLGTPVVNIGTRQWRRERAANVVDVPNETGAIREAVERQLKHGPYRRSYLYGHGDSGERIAEVVCRTIKPNGGCLAREATEASL